MNENYGRSLKKWADTWNDLEKYVKDHPLRIGPRDYAWADVAMKTCGFCDEFYGSCFDGEDGCTTCPLYVSHRTCFDRETMTMMEKAWIDNDKKGFEKFRKMLIKEMESHKDKFKLE